MILIVLSEIHSSSGQIKTLRHDSIELPRHFTAEGISFSYLFLKSFIFTIQGRWF